MSFDNKFKTLVNEVLNCEIINEMSSPEDLASKINILFTKQDVMTIDVESLEDKIKGLSENAMLALLEAIK